MMNYFRGVSGKSAVWAVAMFVLALAVPWDVQAFTLIVKDKAGNLVNGFRWMLEEDTTNWSVPGNLTAYSISLDTHNSYAPVEGTGLSVTSSAAVPADPAKRYLVSVLPFANYSVSGTNVAPGEDPVTVIVNPVPIPTAQISVLVFQDHYPINNTPEAPLEPGLANFTIVLADYGGAVSQDAFGNPLGTTYQQNPDGSYVFDVDGNPVPDVVGTGILKSNAGGECLIKYLAPGKYGIQVIPPAGTNWVQTSTIEGTPTIDAWVKAKESPLFFEGFGTGFHHAFFGFVDPTALPWAVTPPGGSATIRGRLVNNHFEAPPTVQGFHVGHPITEGWVALNSIANEGLIALPVNANAEFEITNVPAGTYQLVSWDKPLLQLFGFNTVTVADGQVLDLGDVFTFGWFGNFQGKVFLDADEDGFPDPGEAGIPEQNVNIRFRDGSIYQAQPTDINGEYEFSGVFPFFKWLVVEVDFLRYKATGLTLAVDAGGAVPVDDGWVTPSRGQLTPQPQPEVNPNTGNNLSRTETGPVLTQAMQLYLGQANVIDWGKANYGPGENGGISGVVFYQTTRAENDPRLAVGDPWEPGVPRVQVALYRDTNMDGVIDDIDGVPGVTRADVDNHPFGWRDGLAPRGTEDVDWNNDNTFQGGDAIAIVTTDSWDDNKPSGCIQTPPTVHGQVANECFDNFGTWNQIRPGVFDGGYAFTAYTPGGVDSGNPEVDGLPKAFYIVEMSPPPGFAVQKEEDKNVDFGDSYIPEILPPVCVGDPHIVPPQLLLFPGVAAPFAGESRVLCDLKQVIVRDAQNTAADFHIFTEVPKAARAVGFINNDLSAEFKANSPIFGEKAAPAWLPISVQDWNGNELTRVYTDEWGGYNAMLPSTFTVNVPSPSGVSPQMATMCLNHPMMPDPLNPGALVLDPYFDPSYSQSCWTFQYYPGITSYLDTPVVPLAAFAGGPAGPLDVEPPDATPVIASVSGPGGGAVVCATPANVTLAAVGNAVVPNPGYNPDVPGSQPTVTRDFGFGATSGTVTLNGTSLAIVSWTNMNITVTVPAGAASGELRVTRGDNDQSTETGAYLLVGCASVVHVPTQYATIQAAIDASADGTTILVHPGIYNENVILYKNVVLQGSGYPSTVINGNPSPTERIAQWHAKLVALTNAGEIPVPVAPNAKEAPVIYVLANSGRFTASPNARISGFTLVGSLAGGGIYVDDHAAHLEIHNNRIWGNQGNYGGGITAGSIDVISDNPGLSIHHNRIVKNGGILAGGGVTLFGGSTGYAVTDNLIGGNFSRFSGGGLCHLGTSDGGRIENNRIVFNEVFYGMLTGGEGGGIYLSGSTAAGLSAGAGDVLVQGNLLQGNMAGSANGGGVAVRGFNGQDVADFPSAPENWFLLRIFDNLIVNNVAGYMAGGLFFQDAANVRLVNNTIANNDSTATAASAFPPGNLALSDPQPAGIVGMAHSAQLQAAFGAGFEQVHSSPVIHDNILRHNRSFHYDTSLNGGLGGLAPDPSAPVYWDLAVVGTPVPETLDPQYCLLTSTAGTSPTNITGDPAFTLGYVNTLYTAQVTDEGGNSITVRYSPIQEEAGNYHIGPGSAALDAGGGVFLGTFAELALDVDGEGRPLGAGPDIGADEFYDPAGPFADVGVMQVASPNPGSIGLPMTFTVTVSNAGPDGASAVVLTDTLPAGVTFSSATPSQGSCSGTGPVSCALGALAPAASATVAIVVVPTSAGFITNTAFISAAEQDPVSANNQSVLNAAVAVAPLAAPENVRVATGGPEASGGVTFAWDPPASLGDGCTAVSYDLLRSASGSDFSGAVCVASNITATVASDNAAAAPGQIWFYLVRAENACGSNMGTDSAGNPRVGATCP